jgi:hypothetical protein
MDLLEFGLLWQLCGGRVIRRETADRQDNREPDPIMEKLHLIRDWRGGVVVTDLSRLVVPVRTGHTWQKRRRKPKASRQIARAEGFDEWRGRSGKPPALGPRPIWRAFHFCLDFLRRWASCGSKPQTPFERNRPHCGINAR